MGRHPSYTGEFADLVLSEIEDGKSLRQICEGHPELPNAATIRRWVSENYDGFRDKYATSKREWAERMAEELVDIADDTSRDTTTNGQGEEIANTEWISRSRLRVDTRKWIISKLLPKVYGERIQQEVTGADGGPLVVSWMPAVAPKS